MTRGSSNQWPPATALGTTGRVLAILRVLAEAGDEPVAFSEIVRRLQLPRATTHRFLKILQEYGIAQPDDRRGFCAGVELYRLAALLNQGPLLDRLARSVMRELVRTTEETSLLAHYLESDRRIAWIMMERGTKALGYTLSLDSPTTPVWGASGRVILAYLPEKDVDEILARDRGERSPTRGDLPPKTREFKQLLAEIRRQGYATSLGHRLPNAYSISAPIFDARSKIIGALSVSIPELRVKTQTEIGLAPYVVSKASELSGLLGYRPHVVQERSKAAVGKP
jgi:DNA-binding IclR family transcriptional regulator